MAYTEPEEKDEPEGIKLEPSPVEYRHMGFLAGLAGRVPDAPEEETARNAYALGYLSGVLARQPQPLQDPDRARSAPGPQPLPRKRAYPGQPAAR